ncbi:hypothetical protein GNF10_12170 [Nostoc sp. UCD121]|uniref:hypothetical protein n=1 Tax=unclassified Nostoc TaxID=2593658 RepID=UPI00162808AD|nr:MULTISPECIES: hypothetical protein [unclassified Nostoc]MBC1224159.1 hypothetical protein [Nostoc sp. UCD120]MBC1276719.1 hypothetical protein [Nostoc sp. UCD121]MBC1296567.1 hypothetical protein [Nostoc sp. UCD122]
MINRNQAIEKFQLTPDQINIFDQLTLAQKRRLIKVLEGKQGQRRVIKASSNPRRAKTNQATQDTRGIENQYQDRLM